MSLEHISNWLKGSVPGIIVLGAVGSILAIILLKTLTLIFNKFIKHLMGHFLVNRIKPYVMYKALASGYERNNDWNRLIILSVFIAGGFFTSSIILFIVLVLSGFYFYYNEVNISYASFLVIFSIILCGNFWLKDAFGFVAIYKVLFERHVSSIKEIFKDKETVISQFLKEGKRPDQEKAALPDEAK